MQATMAIFLGFPGGDEADVELPDDGIEPDGSQRSHVEATPHLATTAEDGTLVTHLAGIAVEWCHADQGSDLAARGVSRFGHIGDQRGDGGRADAAHVREPLGEIGMMRFDVCVPHFATSTTERKTMKMPTSVAALEDMGRVQLSKSFYFRDFLYSEIANHYGMPNIPDDPDLAIAAGRRLCEELLEPLQEAFGRIAIRSAYRSPSINEFGNRNKLNCASNEKNYAAHIWDRRDENGYLGATTCVVLPWFAERYAKGADWRSMAWWIHDHLPYSALYFFPKLAAFNIRWHERPERRIDSYVPPKGCLARLGMPRHEGDHSEWYVDFPKTV